MNERYLFRGKRLNDEWVQGYYSPKGLDCSTLGYNFVAVEDIDDCYNWNSRQVQVYPNTIGQCTGLCDKDGTLIFEGDIIKGVLTGITAIVRFGKYYDGNADDYALGFYVRTKIDGEVVDISFYEKKDDEESNKLVEIIGNVHDTTDLFVGGAK